MLFSLFLVSFYAEEEIILNTKDFPHVKVRDIVEIYHPDDPDSRILLQVNVLKDEMQTNKGIPSKIV